MVNLQAFNDMFSCVLVWVCWKGWGGDRYVRILFPDDLRGGKKNHGS